VKAKQPGISFAEQVGCLRRSMRRALIKQLALRSDRPINQLLALRSIAMREVETQAELAVRLLIDPPAASRLVAQLERDGLLERLEGRNRREVRLKVTAAAAAEIRTIRAGVQWLDAEVLKLVGPAAFKATMKSMAAMQRGFEALSI
jgi:MarR family transcriptional regulator, transcriptional regulator for hemolysin